MAYRPVSREVAAAGAGEEMALVEGLGVKTEGLVNGAKEVRGDKDKEAALLEEARAEEATGSLRGDSS